jgi:hypothetical protein
VNGRLPLQCPDDASRPRVSHSYRDAITASTDGHRQLQRELRIAKALPAQASIDAPQGQSDFLDDVFLDIALDRWACARCAHAMQCGPLTTSQCADLSKPCKRRVQRRNRRQRAMALRTRRLQACNALVSIESVLIADNPFKPSHNSTEGEPRRDSSLKRPPGTQM